MTKANKIIDIFILSYNRPEQLKRIFESFRGFAFDNVRIIIKDDCSPSFIEIEQVFEYYKNILNVEVLLHKNELNLGYDLNLLDCFNVAESEYLYLLSDDDYLNVGELYRLLEYIKLTKKDFYISTHSNHGKKYRQFESISLSSVYKPDFVYNSILFSGLIFKVSRFNISTSEIDFLKNCIYSQVYVVAKFFKESKEFECFDGDVLMLGGDGENYFGKNNSSSALESKELSDRQSILSNFNYQRRLLKVVKYIDENLFEGAYSDFKHLYSIRLTAYFVKARVDSKDDYMDLYRLYIDQKDVTVSKFFMIIIYLIRFIPSFLSRFFYRIGILLLRK